MAEGARASWVCVQTLYAVHSCVSLSLLITSAGAVNEGMRAQGGEIIGESIQFPADRMSHVVMLFARLQVLSIIYSRKLKEMTLLSKT